MKKMIAFLTFLTTIVQANSPLNRVQIHLQGLLTLRDEIVLKMSNAKHSISFECSVKVPWSSSESAIVIQAKDTIQVVTRGVMRKDLQVEVYEFFEKQTPLHHFTFAGDSVVVSDIVTRNYLIGQHKETKKTSGLKITEKLRRRGKQKTTRVEIYKPFLHKHLGCFRNEGVTKNLAFNVLKGINIGVGECASECEGAYPYMGYQANICFCGTNENFKTGKSDTCRDGRGSDNAMDVYSLEEITWPMKDWITHLPTMDDISRVDNISKMFIKNGIPFDGKFLVNEENIPLGAKVSSLVAKGLHRKNALSFSMSNYDSMKETTMCLLKREKNKHILEAVFENACLTENLGVLTFMLQYLGFTAAHALKLAQPLPGFGQELSPGWERRAIKTVHFSTRAFMDFLRDWEKRENERKDKK